MKILLCTLNYTPELTGIGKYSGEMATWLAAQGHEVRVVTTPPYYPDWSIGIGYSGAAYRTSVSEGVAVTRCPFWVPAKPSGLTRLIHLATFALSSLPVMLLHAFWRPDVVWMVAPSFFCAPGTWLAARLCGAPVWLHVQDYEVDAAFDLGLLKGAFLRRMVLVCERWMFRRFDRVSTISQRMLERASAKGVLPERLVSFPNWVDISSVHPDLRSAAFRAELGVAPDGVMVLYSGNLGKKQGLEILAQAAHELQGVAGLHFVFCGRGAAREDLVALSAGLPNVHFLDLQPLEMLGRLLASADIHLLPQRGDAADLVMPSKLTGMLASGRPVVATAHAGTEVARVVEGCGLVVEPEDLKAFAAAILSLVEDAYRRAALGRAARTYAENYLSRDSVLRAFEQELFSLRRGG